MHSLPNQESVTRFRWVASLLLFNRLLIFVALVLLFYSLAITDRELTHRSLALVAVSVLVTLIQMIAASRARCPLCIGLPFRRNACVKHRDARRALGSYRLRVALAVIFRGQFRCPYCGEATAIRTRQRHHRRHDGPHQA
ncbi:MAG: hypothetical protein WCP45_08615 [Verrucomicrobiota bacterium]